jgi:hypothetical protein
MPGDSVIPHVADGDAWSTSMTFTNLGTAPAIATLWFIDNEGFDLYLPLEGIGMVNKYDLNLPVNATVTIQSSGASAGLRTGWAYLSRKTDDTDIAGFAVFRARVGGKPDFEAVVPLESEINFRSVLLFDNMQGFVTSVAMANSWPWKVYVQAKVRDTTGAILQETQFPIESLGHMAFELSKKFPVTEGKRGSVEFRAQSYTDAVSILGLRFNPSGAFTSFHTLTNSTWLATGPIPQK